MNRVATAGELSASIAHEVNQPLTGIVTRASAARRWLAAERPDIDKARAALDQIEAAGHRASDIVKNVRSMFRKDTQDKSPVDINKLIWDSSWDWSTSICANIRLNFNQNSTINFRPCSATRSSCSK